MASSEQQWQLYLIRCNDGSLYTGITTELNRRFEEHSAGATTTSASKAVFRGAKFLRGKGPLALVYHTTIADRSQAQKFEYRVKRLSKSAKEELVAQQLNLGELKVLLKL